MTYKLYTYLEALKYLPQEEIAALCPTPPQRYAIELSRSEREDGETRRIYYTKDGATQPGGWQIRLDILPIYAAGDGSYRGTGEDVISVYYSAQALEVGIQVGDTVFRPRYDKNDFNFHYDELSTLELTGENQALPIALTEEFEETAYLGFDAYRGNRVDRGSLSLPINDEHVAYLNVGDGPWQNTPYVFKLELSQENGTEKASGEVP